MQRFHQSLLVEGLEQVIERVYLKRLRRILIVSRDEDDERPAPGFEQARNGQAIKPRHLHVQEDQVGRVRFNGGQSLVSIAAFADDFHLRVEPQRGVNLFPHQRLVVHNQNPNFCCLAHSFLYLKRCPAAAGYVINAGNWRTKRAQRVMSGG
ncbi:MAG: hypothetical protein JMDDDDMK_04824 [Acidobacteria bacterium]|nr:hypothetical protein [Acidobacteriota bacterium]